MVTLSHSVDVVSQQPISEATYQKAKVHESAVNEMCRDLHINKHAFLAEDGIVSEISVVVEAGSDVSKIYKAVYDAHNTFIRAISELPEPEPVHDDENKEEPMAVLILSDSWLASIFVEALLKYQEEVAKEEQLGINSNGHEYVDLGLPSGNLWATANVGVTDKYPMGGYCQWGDGEVCYPDEEPEFSKETYDVCPGSKLKSDIPQGALTYDTVNINMGGDWVMPSDEDWQELIDTCKWEWTSSYGITGYKIVGPNKKSIFLPCSGGYNSGGLSSRGSGGYYWSTRYDSSSYAYYLTFGSNYKGVVSYYRYYGLSVRGVIKPKKDENAL